MPLRAPARSVLLHAYRLGCMLQALGCLLYYIMYGKLAFGAEAKLQILNGDFAAPATRPAPMLTLLRELLVTQPAKRPGTCICASRHDRLPRPYRMLMSESQGDPHK